MTVALNDSAKTNGANIFGRSLRSKSHRSMNSAINGDASRITGRQSQFSLLIRGLQYN
jgi:hypothetical protein